MKNILKKLSVIFWLTPFYIAVLLYFTLPHLNTFSEYAFSRGIFKVFSFVIGGLVSLIPISLGEFLLILSPLMLIAVIVIFIVKLKKSKKKSATVTAFIKGVLFSVSCVFLLYMFMHGANYYRYSLDELMGLEVKPREAQYLYEVTRDLAIRASDAREECTFDKNGNMKLSADIFEISKQVENGYTYLYNDYPYLKGIVKRVKPVILLSHAWSYTGFSGVYFVWAGEANINIDMPDFTIPSCAAHEIAHTRGIAKENECNFISFLSCINSDYADYRYSGYMLALRNCLNQLYSADKELFNDAYTYVSDGAYSDIVQLNEYLDQFEGEVNEAAGNFNDNFIKVQGVESGAKSYGEMVDLVLAYYDEYNLV